MSGMINNNVNIGTSLTQEIIQKPQKYASFQSKSYNEPKKDTVEISSKQNEDSAKLSKWKKSALAIGAVALAGLGLGIGVKKIGTKQIEKAAEEARKLAKEAQLKAQKEAEQKAEEARIQAEQRAKELAEQRAKELAERKAKIEAETKAKAEAERIAKIEAERVAKAKLQKENIDTAYSHFTKKYDLALHNNSDIKKAYNISNLSTQSFTDDIIGTLKTIEENGGTEASVETFYRTLVKEHSLSDAEIQTITDSYSQLFPSAKFQVKHQLLSRRQLLQEIDELSKQTPKNERESFSTYMQRLFETRANNVAEKNKRHIQELRAGIKYTDYIPDTTITDKDIEILHANGFNDITKENASKELIAIGRGWVNGYTGDYMERSVSKEVEDILVKKGFPRYNSTTDSAFQYYPKFGEVQPTARWLRIGDNIKYEGNVDKFVEENFKVGEEYVAPSIQSCSKNLEYAESTFNDNMVDFDVKFIIHPHGKTSKAADIGYGQYGNLEVIYPQGSKFNVLDKRLVEHKTNSGKTVYRWEIEMQETAPAKQSGSISQKAGVIEKELSTKTKPELSPQFQKIKEHAYEIGEETLLIDGKATKFEAWHGTSLGGSNGGCCLYNKETGEVFYYKLGGEQSSREVLASKLYQLGGINVADMKQITTPEGKTGSISKFIPNCSAVREPSKGVNEGFAMDAFLADWDAVVSNNTITDGIKTYRIDVGGSLDFRARGGKKTPAQFNERVQEFGTFFNGTNPKATYLYSSLTREELIASIKRVTNIKDEQIEQLCKEYNCDLAELLIKRKQYMQEFLTEVEKTPQKDGEGIGQYIIGIDRKMTEKTA